MNDNTTAPSMEEAHAILDNACEYNAVADTTKALALLRRVVDGELEVTQERLNAISMLYQVAAQREQIALGALQIAAQLSGAAEPAQH